MIVVGVVIAEGMEEKQTKSIFLTLCPDLTELPELLRSPAEVFRLPGEKHIGGRKC